MALSTQWASEPLIAAAGATGAIKFHAPMLWDASFQQGQSLEDFLLQAFSIESCLLNYIDPMPPIATDGLRPLDTEECNPPHTRLPRGRPRKPRIDNSTQKAAQRLSREDLESAVAVDSSVSLFWVSSRLLRNYFRMQIFWPVLQNFLISQSQKLAWSAIKDYSLFAALYNAT